jgi:hypothetical protein
MNGTKLKDPMETEHVTCLGTSIWLGYESFMSLQKYSTRTMKDRRSVASRVVALPVSLYPQFLSTLKSIHLARPVTNEPG